ARLVRRLHGGGAGGREFAAVRVNHRKYITTTRRFDMRKKRIRVTVFPGLVLSVVAALAPAAQDKYTVKVPGRLAFSEFRGYEAWQAISISRNEKVVAVILGNPVMIGAYRAGIPGNGKPVPDGAKMAKVHWAPKPNEFFPEATVPGRLLNVDFMVKDS